MDEVDNIIIHSLRQIGCKINDDTTSLSSFTPELLVETVSKCLQLIKPSLVLPKTLPPGMAQRFTVTASLAEACAAIGFRGDIGYQTFLYSNVTEVRRVFMFLIERLPKENEKLAIAQPIDQLTALENVIQRNIKVQLQTPWIPQYCNKTGIRKYNESTVAVSAESAKFKPQLNLNIPITTTDPNDQSTVPPELQRYWTKRSPSIFQQTNSQTVCPSVIHKNDIEFFNDDRRQTNQTIQDLIKAINRQRSQTASSASSSIILPSASSSDATLHKSVDKLTISSDSDTNKTGRTLPLSSLEELKLELERMRNSIEELLSKRKLTQGEITKLKEKRADAETHLAQLNEERKIKERTYILLENPEVNISKMEGLVAGTKDRMKKLQEQWDEHRKPLEEALEKSASKNNSKSSQNKLVTDQIKSIREKSSELTEDLKMKTIQQSQMASELQKIDKTVSRDAYTTRILEIIGNIRKQKNDIDKVLRDTRELQKQINNITGQLDRQFTVTDDLLFKTAKRDEPSKKAYKLLATLHSDCSNLVALVQETGSVMREVRDLEDQIENEKARNIATNLEKITYDLKQMEKESKELQEKIRKVENQIIQG